jgi:hypothetical protein
VLYVGRMAPISAPDVLYGLATGQTIPHPEPASSRS